MLWHSACALVSLERRLPVRERPVDRVFQTNRANQMYVGLMRLDYTKVTRGTMITRVGDEPSRQLTTLEFVATALFG